MFHTTTIKVANDKRLRKETPWIGIVIHHTGIGGRKTISEKMWRKLNGGIVDWLIKADKFYLSAHYQIGRFGELTQLVNPETHVSYHAGKSSWWHPIKRRWVKGCNDYFIGIEMLGDGNLHSYNESQYQTLAKLCNALCDRFRTIQPTCIVGHEMISPGRKDDPGIHFDWKRFNRELYRN